MANTMGSDGAKLFPGPAWVDDALPTFRGSTLEVVCGGLL